MTSMHRPVPPGPPQQRVELLNMNRQPAEREQEEQGHAGAIDQRQSELRGKVAA